VKKEMFWQSHSTIFIFSNTLFIAFVHSNTIFLKNIKMCNVPMICTSNTCHEPFNLTHIDICSKGGVIHRRHDYIKFMWVWYVFHIMWQNEIIINIPIKIKFLVYVINIGKPLSCISSRQKNIPDYHVIS
jgi:hypothetical protein